MQTKFAIGCLVQWYEIEILVEYIDTLIKAIDEYDRDKVLIDIEGLKDKNREMYYTNGAKNGS